MRNLLTFASVFAACLTLGAQDDAKIKLPKDPKAILEMAAPLYDYDPATAKPFHLSYHYRLLDDQGKASSEGSFEVWWSPGNVSRSWKRGDNSHSEWSTDDGRFLQSVKGDDITSMEHRLSSAVLISLPKPQGESGQTDLRLVTINNAGSVNLCLASAPAKAPPVGLIPSADFLPEGLRGTGTAYCFDGQAPVLVFTLQNHTITNFYSLIQKFQDHNIAGHIDILYAGERKLEANLIQSGEVQADNAAFTPAPDAKEPVIHMITVKHAPGSANSDGSIRAAIKPGVLLQKVPPVYPPAARAARISGIVIVQAMIGKDGLIYDAKVVTSPDDSLSQAALDAVRQWRYQPYTLNGAPVAVMTTINVEFTLNR